MPKPIQPMHVVTRSKKSYFIVYSPISFHPFEKFLSIMENLEENIEASRFTPHKVKMLKKIIYLRGWMYF